MFIHPCSVLCDKPPSWVVFNEMMVTSKPYMRDVTKIKPELLQACAPHFFTLNNNKKKN